MTELPLRRDPVVEALRRGNEAVLGNLVAEYRDAMLRTARSYVADPSTGEDVVQDTWLAVLRGIDGFDERSSLRTWIFAILTNRAKTTGQRNGRVVPISSLERDHDVRSGDNVRFFDARADATIGGSVARALTPEDVAVVTEDVHAVLAAIATLPATQRAAITMRDVQGRSAAHACSALGLSEGNQRVVLHRARTEVRRMLGELDATSRWEPSR